MRLRKEHVAVGLVGLIACLLCAGPAAAAPGERDRGFDKDGIVKIGADPSSQNVEDRIEIDFAGRYVVLADAGSSRVLRFQQDGDLDQSFGSGGIVTSPEGSWHDLVLQPDGGIVLAGSSKRNFAVARLTADGRLDPAFGNGGTATAHVDLNRPIASDRYLEEAFERVKLDGSRIVALGDVRGCTAEPEPGREPDCSPESSVVARFTAAGDPDPDFGGGSGFFSSDASLPSRFRFSDFNSLAIQADGRILAGGSYGADLFIARLTAAGALDASFSGDGLVRSRRATVISEGEVLEEGAARALLLQRSGRIVAVAGEVLVAFKPSGALDRSFSPGEADGVAPIENTYTTNLSFDPAEAAVDKKDRLLVAGDSRYLTSVARFYPNGEHDPRFAGDGLAHVNLSKNSLENETREERATDLALEPNGAPVTAGFAYAGKHSRPALTRWHGGDGHRASCHGKPAILQGTPGGDRLSAPGPIVAFGGDDEIHSWYGLICAGDGDDDVEAGSVGTTYGGAGEDRILSGGSSHAYGGGGDDVILTRKGYDGRNVYYGGAGDDLLAGGRGPDLLFGGPGADQLIGGRGNDRLFGGPGADEESGEGGGGRKTVYQAQGKEGFRIRLVVRKHQITGVHVHVRLHCSSGYDGSLSWNTNRAGIRIHPDGRFRYTDSFGTEEGFSETLLKGRVIPDRIVGVYRQFESTVNSEANEACRTGTRKHPQIEFVARR